MNNKWSHDGNVFQQTGTIFELVQDIIGTNLLTKFHEDPSINVASTVLTRQIFMTHNGRKTIDTRLFTWFHYIHIEKTFPPPGGHTKSVTSRVFTCFHYIHIEKTAPPPGGHFHNDWTKIVTSKVFTMNTAPPPGGHVFQRTGTIFELNQHII
ncbi:hypothetical protein DPMN_147783 [Dreissena polymorpha]|uniref:Uncharacterized protein n=1 Tax=Dreissena polymorpha TaxID=45954 RepID=A0A9D4FEC0_DREPO|nr:hypothetical protein DPMN_147783 [Dreissena polymorpha]